MIHKLTILSGLIISTTCAILPHIPIQVPLLIQYQFPTRIDEPNYSFSYDVNNEETGDVKNQQESRNGGTVTGQYSLIQPDGIRRTVDYKADDLRGFTASVNNERNGDIDRQADKAREENFTPQSAQNVQNVTPAPSVSRTSLVQNIYTRRILRPWI